MMRFCIVLVAALVLSGCNAAQVAQDAYKAVEAIVAVAQVEAAAVPAQDRAAYNSFVSLAGTLSDQLNTCINTSGTKSAKLLVCFNAYAAGLNSPTELAQLRVLSPASQKKAQLYIVAIVAGVNVALREFGGASAQVTAPVITPAVLPATAELDQLRNEIAAETGLIR